MSDPDTSGSPHLDASVRGGADDQSKIDGIVDQVRGDIQLGHIDDTESELTTRLDQAGVDVSAEDVGSLTDEVESDASR